MKTGDDLYPNALKNSSFVGPFIVAALGEFLLSKVPCSPLIVSLLEFSLLVCNMAQVPYSQINTCMGLEGTNLWMKTCLRQNSQHTQEIATLKVAESFQTHNLSNDKHHIL